MTPRPSGRDMLLATQSEEQWQAWVMREAGRNGWHGFHVTRSAMRSASGERFRSVYEGLHEDRMGEDHDDRKGVPDLFLVHPERELLLIPELKRTGGRLDADQKRWLNWLARVRYVSAPVWWPQDEREVQAVLRGTGGAGSVQWPLRR